MKNIVIPLALLSVRCLAVPEATVYRTEGTGEMREVVANFWSKFVAEGSNVIDLDAAKDDHAYLGLGVSFPESSCYLLSKLPAERRRAILEMVWTKKGANLTVGRIHCGASDYSMHLYSYDDTPGDGALGDFSIDPDRKYVIPVIREALALQPELYLFSSPWSPPAWMKDNNNFGGGRVLEKWYGVYADYVVRFLKEYAAEGVAIRAFTVQNEPETEQSRISPTCRWTGAEEAHVNREIRPMAWWGKLLLRSLSCGCGAFVSWCLALDENGQPNVSGGFPCAGFVTIDSKTGEVVPSGQYRCFRHVGPFVARGARILDAPLAVAPYRWGADNAKKAVHCAFRNPDGSDVVVFAFPRTEKDGSCDRAQVVLKKDGAYLVVQLLENSMTTVVLK